MTIYMHYLKKIGRWLLPYTCLLCKETTHRAQDLCEACERGLPLLQKSCPRCACPLTETAANGNDPSVNLSLRCKDSLTEVVASCDNSLTDTTAHCHSLLTTPVTGWNGQLPENTGDDAHPLTTANNQCPHCFNLTLPFDRIHALYLYQPPITQLILGLKFKHALVNARILGELLTKQIQQIWYRHKPLPDSILPIPLHASRLKERGFNQAVEIARPIAKAIKRPILLHAASRTKATCAQTTLNAIERQHNMQDAFKIHVDLTNQHIALLDDVVTTGATIMAFCHLLQQAGARQVDVWCAARVPPGK